MQQASTQQATWAEQPRTSCALAGALAAVSAMPGVAPVLHTALGCGGSLYGALSLGAGGYGSAGCSGSAAPSSGVTETEIVFGGDGRLREQIRSTLELIKAELYVVLTGCMTEMIGDDAAGVSAEFEGQPVIALSTPSFKGDSYTGYEILLDGVFNRWLPSGSRKKPRLVNIFGVVPAYDTFFRGDLEEIARLLQALGLEVNTFFTPGQTFKNIRSAPEAALNLVLSPTWGLEFAEKFEIKHSTPFLATTIPLGAEQTDAFLRLVAGKFHIDPEPLIARENAIYYDYWERAADVYCDGGFIWSKAAVVSNANYAAPLARFAERELGWELLDVFVTDLLDDTRKQQAAAAFDGLSPVFETDTTRVAAILSTRSPRDNGNRYFDKNLPQFILGSSLEKSLAARLGAGQLTVSFPAYNRQILDRSYAGYRGGLHLLEDILGVLVYPKM
jgi:nitrogenase molybdenum-iron protein beta chain